MTSIYEPKLSERLVEIDISISVNGKLWSDIALTNEQIEEGITGELAKFIDLMILPPANTDDYPYIISRSLNTAVIVKDAEG